MKKVLIIHSNMELGGAETSLLGLLQTIDYSEYSVDLLLLEQTGPLLELIPESVNILNTPRRYRHLMSPIAQVVREGDIPLACARLYGKWKGRKFVPRGYATKQFAHLAALRFLPEIEKEYDVALSFIDPHIIIREKVKAKKRFCWLHFDFKNVRVDSEIDRRMWDGCDYIVHISESCKAIFDHHYPELTNKSIVIENVLSREFVRWRANAFSVDEEMGQGDEITLLSIGRFSKQKNFDNIPDICRRLQEKNIHVKWYIIGYGNEEDLIRQRIREAQMEEYVILLGKKENPYPYIKACDVYIQPSRWEGKCVAVREAQMLGKPVVITNYATAQSQLQNGYDGIVVPMENEACADSLARILNNERLLKEIAANTETVDYSNVGEIKKILQ